MRRAARWALHLGGWLGVWLIVTSGGSLPLSGRLIAGACLVGLAVRLGERF